MFESTLACAEHNKQYRYICLTRGRSIDQKFMCEECRTANVNRLSASEIVMIEQVRNKLINTWGDGFDKIDPLRNQINAFYDTMREQLLKQLDEDRVLTFRLMERLMVFHLPFELDAQNFNSLIHGRLDRVNPIEIQKMLDYPKGRKNEAAIKKENQILNTLKMEMSKLHQKLLSLKYILLAKKIETDFIIPQLEGQSKIGSINQFSRLGALFNSRNKMIRTMKLVYRGSENNFSHESYVKTCRNLRNCVALVKCENNKIVGGYTPLPLVLENPPNQAAQDKYRSSFIFNISSIKAYNMIGNHAIEYSKDAIGPHFGKDLKIGKEITSMLGCFYNLPDGVKPESMEAKVALLQAEKNHIVEMQIWQLAF